MPSEKKRSFGDHRGRCSEVFINHQLRHVPSLKMSCHFFTNCDFMLAAYVQPKELPRISEIFIRRGAATLYVMRSCKAN